MQQEQSQLRVLAAPNAADMSGTILLQYYTILGKPNGPCVHDQPASPGDLGDTAGIHRLWHQNGQPCAFSPDCSP